MKKVDNNVFLEFFEQEDIIRYFFDCENITNAGNNETAVKSIEYYTANGTPDISYVSFCENIFNELIVEFNTSDSELINDTLIHIRNIDKKYKKVRIGALSTSFYNSKVFKKHFKIKHTYFAEYGVFAQYSKDNLPETVIPENVICALADNIDNFLNFDDEEWDGLSTIIEYSLKQRNNDDMFFIIKKMIMFVDI